MSNSITFADSQRWFTVSEPLKDVFAIAEPLHPEHVRSYLVTGEERGVLIDTGTGIGDIRAIVEQLTDRPVSVITSHAHWDHIGGNWQFDEIAIHPAEASGLDTFWATEALRESSRPDQLMGPLPPGVIWEDLEIRPSKPTAFLHGGETIDLGGVALDVIHAPGHSPGLLGFLDRKRALLLSTDIVYPGPLYAYDDDANIDDYVASLTMLAELSRDLHTVLPCHNGDSLDPAVIPRMRDAMIAVAEGRIAESTDEEKATHTFEGFSIYAPLSMQHIGAGG